ncbi:PilN domain-containing protein [Vibrio ostreae]|uniref:PilN domain-containing protein n=1 Tax=Vibrio ostreae TaxID=2841925 RepID=A0A975YND2_9VIBR|nr:PilN domain-containing protein [Vibrio ostreae]QXO17628.1 PilN domain-containing protein [Vibrio ostreae]
MSAEVNFLPWREHQRVAAQHRFVAASLAAVMFGLVLLALVAWQQQSRITQRQQQLSALQLQSAQLARYPQQLAEWQHKLARSRAHQESRQQLLDQRHHAERLMQQLASTVPPGVYLDSVIQSVAVVEVRGVSLAADHLHNLLEQLQEARSVSAVNIELIAAPEHRFGSIYQPFELSFRWQPERAVQP